MNDTVSDAEREALLLARQAVSCRLAAHLLIDEHPVLADELEQLGVGLIQAAEALSAAAKIEALHSATRWRQQAEVRHRG